MKTIFEEWNNDEYVNMEKLAQKLKDDGIKRGNKYWTRNNISDVLTNPIYMGIRVATFDNQQVSRSVEELSIIAPEDFDLAQQLIEKRRKPIKEREKFHYLLSGLVFCELCEQKRLVEQEKSKVQIERKPVVENQRTRNGKAFATYECKEHNIKLDQLEIESLVYIKTKDFYSELFKTHFDQLYSVQLKKNLFELSKRQSILEKELETEGERLVQSTSKWLNRGNDSNREKMLECSRDVKQIKDKIFDLETKRQQFLDVPGFADEIKKEVLKKETWELLPFVRKQELIKDLVQCIFVDDDTIRIVFKHPFLEANEVIV